MDAFTDPDTTAVWCARGGYGIVRLLDQLDFDVIRHHPKVFIGFSDITALHLAIQQRVGLITFHGPNLQDGFGAIDIMTAMTDTALWQAMLADAQSWSQPEYSLPPSSESNVAPRMLAPGIARGRLTGGNLSVLSGLLGTPFEIDTAGRILFLEDVDEPPYRIDRYLSQLRLAGKLQAAAGVLLGKFTDDRQPVSGETESAIAEVLRECFGTLGIPVLSNFPSGHQRTNVTLPMNAMVELQADGGTVRLLENPVAEIRTNGDRSSS
jgi:muramoyltetrapeptide carboxypeptidase